MSHLKRQNLKHVDIQPTFPLLAALSAALDVHIVENSNMNQGSESAGFCPIIRFSNLLGLLRKPLD